MRSCGSCPDTSLYYTNLIDGQIVLDGLLVLDIFLKFMFHISKLNTI